MAKAKGFSLKSKQNEHRYKFHNARSQILGGVNRLFLYGSRALKEVYDKFQKKQPEIFHPEYEPNPVQFQYDLEVYIFLNYEELKHREMELATSDEEMVWFAEFGATMLPRDEHLLNAFSIRWPEKLLKSGEVIGTLAQTPWLKDLVFGISNYQNTVVFGGAGQGKTYGFLAFGCILYDHFIHTQSGAQVSVSTVSQSKLESSSWSYLNTLYRVVPGHQFSLYAGRAYSAGDFMFRRKKDQRDLRYMKEGGTIRGVLLSQGVKDSRQVDKLTGSHSCIARMYLLDEAQATDDAPLKAYTNMYLHPRYKWFGMSGNYEKEGDLLDLNAEPANGWNQVTEETHMWEGKLRTKDSDLGHKNIVIHYNNELSPAITDKDIEKKYGRFMPTIKKRDDLYKTEESRKTYEYKRMWIGFRFEKEEGEKERILTAELLKEYRADQEPRFFTPITRIASFDSAPASKDRNPLFIFDLGLDQQGYPLIVPHKIINLPKPESVLEYYSFTTLQIVKYMKRYNVPNNHLVQDFTQFTALVEMLNRHGVASHLILYQQMPPKDGVNEITKIRETKIVLPNIKTFNFQGFEKVIKLFAHERIRNRISLGAYLTRLFVESGRVRGFNDSILKGVEGHHGFEKEFLMRNFITKVSGDKKDRLATESKDVFKGKYRFSPDLLDCVFQAFYLCYVVFKIRPFEKGLGIIDINPDKIVEDQSENDVWSKRKRF